MNRASFLAAIREDPADDLPRLVYADWLEDEGDADRAEFIRVQCELARGMADRGRGLELWLRIQALLRENRRAWLGKLPAYAVRPIFERGFIDSIRILRQVFVAHMEEILAEHPICHLRIEGLEPGGDELLSSPYIEGMRTLDLHGEPLGNAGLRVLARCRHLRRLRSLDLSDTGCTPAGLDSLLSAGAFPRLESLCLASNRIGNAGAESLLRWSGMASLRQLDLARTGIDTTGAIRLAACPALRPLRLLRLAGNPIGLEGVERMAESPHLIGLEALDMRSCGVDFDERPRIVRRYGARLQV